MLNISPKALDILLKQILRHHDYFLLDDPECLSLIEQLPDWHVDRRDKKNPQVWRKKTWKLSMERWEQVRKDSALSREVSDKRQTAFTEILKALCYETGTPYNGGDTNPMITKMAQMLFKSKSSLAVELADIDWAEVPDSKTTTQVYAPSGRVMYEY